MLVWEDENPGTYNQVPENQKKILTMARASTTPSRVHGRGKGIHRATTRETLGIQGFPRRYSVLQQNLPEVAERKDARTTPAKTHKEKRPDKAIILGTT